MCDHVDCIGTCVSTYDRVAKRLSGFITCDSCGARIQEVYCQDYEPHYIIDDGHSQPLLNRKTL